MTIRKKQIEEKPDIIEEGSKPTTGAGKGAFYVKTVGGIAEGHYADDKGQEIQLTQDGQLLSGVGSGEVNTGSNVGGENEVFKQKSGVDLEFRTISAGSNIAITQNTDTLVIEATGLAAGEANTASNITGGDEGIFYQKSGVDLEFKKISAGSNISLSADATQITIEASDEKSKVSSNDTTPGYLNGKLVAGTNVTFTENNDGANETLEISASGGGSALEVQDEGSSLDTAVTKLNFIGAGVSAVENADHEIDITIGAGSDSKQLLVSSNDTTEGYLNGKLVAGTNVTFTENNDGANETLEISAAGGTDNDAIHDNVSGEINTLTEKTTPVDADLLIIEDSENSYNKKKLQISNLPSGGGSSVGEEFIIQLGSGSTIVDKVNNAPTGGIPSGWSVVDASDGSVDSQLSGSTDDIVFIHSTGKVGMISAITVESAFGGYDCKIPSGSDNFSPGDIKTDSNSSNQTAIYKFNVVVGDNKSWTWIKFAPILT